MPEGQLMLPVETLRSEVTKRSRPPSDLGHWQSLLKQQWKRRKLDKQNTAERGYAVPAVNTGSIDAEGMPTKKQNQRQWTGYSNNCTKIVCKSSVLNEEKVRYVSILFCFLLECMYFWPRKSTKTRRLNEDRLKFPVFCARTAKLARTPIDRGKTSLRQYPFVPASPESLEAGKFLIADLHNAVWSNYNEARMSLTFVNEVSQVDLGWVCFSFSIRAISSFSMFADI